MLVFGYKHTSDMFPSTIVAQIHPTPFGLHLIIILRYTFCYINQTLFIILYRKNTQMNPSGYTKGT